MIYDYRYFTTSLSSLLKNTFENIYTSSELKFSLEFPYLFQEVGIGVKYDKKFKEEDKSKLSKTTVSSLEPLRPVSPFKGLEMSPALYYKIEPKYLDYFKVALLAAYDPLINRVSELSFKLNAYDFELTFAMKDEFEYKYDKLIGDFLKVGTTTKLVPYLLNSQYKKRFIYF